MYIDNIHILKTKFPQDSALSLHISQNLSTLIILGNPRFSFSSLTIDNPEKYCSYCTFLSLDLHICADLPSGLEYSGHSEQSGHP